MTSTYHVADEEAEELAVCGLMRAADLLVAHAGTLAPADFYFPRSRAVAFVALPAARLGEPCDPYTVFRALTHAPEFYSDWAAESECRAYLSAVLALDPTGMWAQAAFRRVEWLARRREAVHEYRRLSRDALSGDGRCAPWGVESLTCSSLGVMPDG